MLAPLANALWLASCLPDAARFHVSKRHIEHEQAQVLAELLRRNQGTAFGRAHDFHRIRSAREFQESVPLASYEDLRPWIERIELGEPNVLTRDLVSLLEPTGGSSQARKLIPCTASLKSEFGRAIAPWIVDLCFHDLRLLLGRAYWSLSPLVARGQRTKGGVPIGFEEDAEYFGRAQSLLIRAVQAVPPPVRLIESTESFRYVSLLFLLRARDLALISVWNPSFLLLLVENLPELWPRLSRDIQSGTISVDLPADLRAQFERLNRADTARAAQIRRACQSASGAASMHALLWPRLRVLSCWDSAHAQREARELAALFPQAQLQGKGLLATEGVVSLPLRGRSGAALAIRSHFFEFLPARSQNGQILIDESPLLAHQLEIGARYAIVLSTGGGLYRYKLQDVVEIVGFDAQCPLLRFVGRADRVSDRRGEKLHEEHVAQALQVLAARHKISARFMMLAPEMDEADCAYTLFIESDARDEALRDLARELEDALRENFHFDLCRRLEQLGQTRVFRIRGGARQSYAARCVELGQRAGDVKPCALHLRAGWARVFEGEYL